jgi:YHS domain-containing protein
MGSVDNKGNRHKFCSKECLNKFGEKSRKSVFTEILD